MKNIEMEERYKIDNNTLKKIIKSTTPLKDKTHIIDITLGTKGFESLSTFGYIIRIRKKENIISMEVKKKQDESFIESKIDLNSVKEGIDFLSLLGMEPYLYIDRTREVRAYKGLKIFIDEIELLGTFVEIEYQNVENSRNLINEFKELVEIRSEKKPLYGDIFKDKIEKDKLFKELFECKISELLICKE